MAGGGFGGGFRGTGPGPGFLGSSFMRLADPPAVLDNAPSVAAAVGHASGTGAAYDLTLSVAVGVGTASGTGQAFDPTTSGQSTGVATGTGAAFTLSVNVGVAVGNAAGTGTAYDVLIEGFRPISFKGMILGVTHFPMTGPGFQPGFMFARSQQRSMFTNATPFISVQVGAATGSGQAYDVQVYVPSDISFPGRVRTFGVGQALAPGFGSINQKPQTVPIWLFGPTSVVPVGTATGTGQAFDLTTSVKVSIGVASGTGSAFNASPTTATPTVQPGLASGTGQAFQVSVSIGAPVNLASGTGTAFSLSLIAAPTVGIAQGSGAAFDITAKISVNVGLASGVGFAYDALASTGLSTSVLVGIATGIGEAYDLHIQATTFTWFYAGQFDVGPIALDPRDAPHPLANRLFRHYRPRERGYNVYILTDGTVTEDRPTTLYDSDGVLVAEDEEQIARTLFGGHIEYLTPEEAASLVNAGYGANITQTVMA